MNLPDDCDELQTLRALRDKRRLYDADFDAMVEEYYRIAPSIVTKIDAEANRIELYKQLYDTMVVPCVCFVKQNRENDAVALYSETVLKLKSQYLDVQ